MQSGIGYTNHGLTGDDAQVLQQKPSNLLEFVFSRDLAHAPGTFFDYKDCDPQILSAVLEKVTGKPTKDWAEEVLFSKVGMTNWKWTTYKDGRTLGGIGILEVV